MTCWKCLHKIEYCLCAEIQKFQTNTRFIILVHPKEFKKEKLGTGRMSHGSLPNSDLWMGIDFSNDNRVNRILDNPENACYILWPGKNSIDLNQTENFSQSAGKQIYIFILDATWSCARKMYRSSINLQKIQRIAITPDSPSEFKFKKQPARACLSTIEAITYVLKGLEKNKLEIKQDWQLILRPFHKMVQRQLDISADPHRKSYRGSSQYSSAEIKERTRQGQSRRKLF